MKDIKLKDFKEMEAIIVESQYEDYSNLELFEKQSLLDLGIDTLFTRIGNNAEVDSQIEGFALVLNDLLLLAETQNIDLTLALNILYNKEIKE
jgi:hypothetical protein